MAGKHELSTEDDGGRLDRCRSNESQGADNGQTSSPDGDRSTWSWPEGKFQRARAAANRLSMVPTYWQRLINEITLGEAHATREAAREVSEQLRAWEGYSRSSDEKGGLKTPASALLAGMAGTFTTGLTMPAGSSVGSRVRPLYGWLRSDFNIMVLQAGSLILCGKPGRILFGRHRADFAGGLGIYSNVLL